RKCTAPADEERGEPSDRRVKKARVIAEPTMVISPVAGHVATRRVTRASTLGSQGQFSSPSKAAVARRKGSEVRQRRWL
ncbi:hypothetical protein EIP91_007718, partial [Steccherinum ochraceum]